jgi:hypothetical protein
MSSPTYAPETAAPLWSKKVEAENVPGLSNSKPRSFVFLIKIVEIATLVMKLLSTLLVTTMAASAQAGKQSSRDLQTLAQKWNITDPTFGYEGLHFDLDYQVSDFIHDDMCTFKIFDKDCQEGGKPVTIFTAASEPLTGTFIGNGGLGERVLALDIDIDAETITSDPNIYSEDVAPGAVTAQIDFCVRFSLWTNTEDPIEVNFLETLVVLYVDLSDGFDIGEVNVAPKLKDINTANQVYLIDGYQCDFFGAELTGAALSATRNQGSIIKVCVEPDQEAQRAGIKMRSIDSFTFTHLTFPAITQPAITGPNTASNNGLTVVTCTAGVDTCWFETLLFAGFYGGPGVVGGAGVGSMQFGSGTVARRGLRGLQQNDPPAATSEFNMDFGVVPVVDNRWRSDASSIRLMAVTAVVAAGVLALI